MRHTKKLIATTMAMTMVMGTMPVLADTIEGDVNYVNTTIYKVTLPTTEGMSFLLDPQGLTSLDAGDYDESAAGKIVSEGTMVATNESSVDVVLNADFYLVDSDTDDSVSIVASTGSITEKDSKQDSKEVQIYITTDDATTTTIEVGSAEGAGTDFTMDAADYEFGGNAEDGYTYDLVADSGSTLTMEIAGNVAKDYDWSAYADGSQTLTLNAVFKFTTADGDDIDAEAADTTPVYSKANGGSIVLDTEKNAVTKVVIGASEDSLAATTKYTWDSITKTLTLTSGLWAAAEEGATRYVQVTYGDGSTSDIIELVIAE